MMAVDRSGAPLRFPQVRLMPGTAGHYWSGLDFLIICYLELGSDSGPGLFNNSYNWPGLFDQSLISSEPWWTAGGMGGTQNNTDNFI